MEINISCILEPLLTDIDAELLSSIFTQEAIYFQQTCNQVNGSSQPLEAIENERNSPVVKIAASLLSHGKEIQEIHRFFKKLSHRRYLMKLASPLGPDNFQVVTNTYRTPYSGTETLEVVNKESGNQLHPQELEVYECALLAAQYPVLAKPPDSSNSTDLAKNQHDQDRTDLELSISPASRECMSYRRSLSRSSVFEFDSDDLTEVVRQAFCLTLGRHNYYLRELEKTLMDDPAKVLVREIREQLLILKNECHPYFRPNLFRQKEDYEMWLKSEKCALENIAQNQEKFVKDEVKSFPSEVPLLCKDKHSWYKRLLVKLFRAESTHCRVNLGTKEAIPKQQLSTASTRLLEEFGERYRIGPLYRRVCLLDYVARNFECKKWFCDYIVSEIESVLAFGKTQACIITKDEIKIVKTAMTYLHSYVEHILTRINRVFPKNAPDGELKKVIHVLSWIVKVDEDDVFGEHRGITLVQYLKKYAKEEMMTNYERQKMIVADRLKLRTFGQQLTPQMINLMISDISEILRNYRMYFKLEFIGYFDIVEMAVEVFYGLLMADVIELCNIYPVNQQNQNIDYLMIALAYRLTLFDHDSAWEHYLSLEGQIWRPSFLKHSFVWMSSLYGKLHQMICTALQHDNWLGLLTSDTSLNIDSTESQRLHQSEQRTRPRVIASPLMTMSPSYGRIGAESTGSITPSSNSAFVQVSNKSGIEKEFSSDVSCPVTSDIDYQSPSSDVTGERPSGSKTEVNSGKSMYSNKSNSSSLLKHVQNTNLVTSSVTSRSTESVYTDARSTTSDDYASGDGAEIVGDNDLVTSHQDQTTIPVSSSLIDTLCGINRLINVARHFSQVLCSVRPASDYDSLRMSPEDRNEIKVTLEQGRMSMARKLGDMVESLVLFYGYYIISCETCGMSNEVLEPIIGQRCLTRCLSLIQENDVRPCGYSTAGHEEVGTTDSCSPSCMRVSRVEKNSAQIERIVDEMCVRLNNVRTMKTLLPFLIKTAVENVLVSDSSMEYTAALDVSMPCVASTSQDYNKPSTSSVQTDVIDKNSIERIVEELQEIEDGLVKLMAYRANDVIKKLLELLLTLNLRSFNSRKRLQPVLNAARKTLHTLAVHLFPDSYAAVLRHFWLAIVEDFVEEKEKLVFLNATAKDQANLLLEAISYFIEIFRAEKDTIPLSFVSTTIEPVLQSLNFYTLPTRNLMQMYEALSHRNTGNVRISDSLSSRRRYQRPPSNVFIGRLRIELHSEHAQHFSGARFVECVSDRIRIEGNLGLGICAVPNGCDSDSGTALGQYLLDNNTLLYVGKVVKDSADQASDEDDEDLDEELRKFTGPGSALFISEKKIRPATVNFMPIASSQDTHSSADKISDSSTIIQEEIGEHPRFSNSEYMLYKFMSIELEDSLNSYHPEYHSGQGDSGSLNDITTVLFTRRNIDQEARNFLADMGANALVQELQTKLSGNSSSNCCWSRSPLSPFNM